MPPQYFIEASLEYRYIQFSREMYCYRFVIKRKIRSQLCVKPYLFLAEGKGNGFAVVSTRYRLGRFGPMHFRAAKVFLDANLSGIGKQGGSGSHLLHSPNKTFNPVRP